MQKCSLSSALPWERWWPFWGAAGESRKGGKEALGWYCGEFYLEIKFSQVRGLWTIWRSFFASFSTQTKQVTFSVPHPFFVCSKAVHAVSDFNYFTKIWLCLSFSLQWVKCFHKTWKIRHSFRTRRSIKMCYLFLSSSPLLKTDCSFFWPRSYPTA